MKNLRLIPLLLVIFACNHQKSQSLISETANYEIKEYNDEGKLIAISNYKDGKSQLRVEDGIQFLETYQLGEIKNFLTPFLNHPLSDMPEQAIILYASEHEKKMIEQDLQNDSLWITLPDDLKFFWEMNPEKKNGTPRYKLFAVKSPKNDTHEKISCFDIKEASSGLTNDRSVVNLTFLADGSDKFAAMTQRNLSRTIAICLNEQVIVAPYVMGVIHEHVEISGNFDTQQCKSIASQINSFTRNGERRLFHPNGQIKEKRIYEKGEATGTYSRYDEQGKLIRKVSK